MQNRFGNVFSAPCAVMLGDYWRKRNQYAVQTGKKRHPDIGADCHTGKVCGTRLPGHHSVKKIHPMTASCVTKMAA
jgi:hypothetical protein